MNGLKVANVSKRFGEVQALKNVNIEFHKNKIYGLLGRNGAGKSTLLNIFKGKSLLMRAMFLLTAKLF